MKLLLTLLISTMVFVGCSNESGTGTLTDSETNALKQLNNAVFNQDVVSSASVSSSSSTLRVKKTSVNRFKPNQ